MARGRPFGVWAYSYGPYSRWHQVVVAPTALVGRGATSDPSLVFPVLHLISGAIGGRSGSVALLSVNFVLDLSGPALGRSSSYAPLRHFWEHEPPSECGNDWSPGAPCVVEWTPAAGCDAAWVVQPKPPFVCPEVTHG